MILISAANGKQGKLLVPKVIAAGLPVSACARSTTRTAGAGVERGCSAW